MALFSLKPFFVKTFHMFLVLPGSNPVQGSSKNMISGEPTIAIAIESLLYIPPESSFALAPSSTLSSKPTSRTAFLTSASSSVGGIPFNLA